MSGLENARESDAGEKVRVMHEPKHGTTKGQNTTQYTVDVDDQRHEH
jgi:hypothetical protein